MPRRLLTLLALLALLATPALVVHDVAAQPSPEQVLSRLEGLETAYARRYDGAQNYDFNLGPTPVVTDSTPDRLIAMVLEFGTDEQVSDAFDNVLNGLVVGAILGEIGMDLDRSEVEGLGDRASLFVGQTDEHAALLAVQDGNFGIIIHAYGEDDAIHETMMDVARYIVDAEPGTAPVAVDDFGASGGTFDMMPGQDDREVLNGLVPMYEYDLLLNGGTEPLGGPGHRHDAPDATPES
jgi:hypothetical protein